MVKPKSRSCPDRGDLGWLSMNPQLGREQAGRRPVLCLSPASYNRKSGLAIFCPITSKVKGYPFEVVISSKSGISGAVLADQLKSLDWKERDFEQVEEIDAKQLADVSSRVAALLQI